MVVEEGQRAVVGKGLKGEREVVGKELMEKRVVVGKELMACRGRRVRLTKHKLSGFSFKNTT